MGTKKEIELPLPFRFLQLHIYLAIIWWYFFNVTSTQYFFFFQDLLIPGSLRTSANHEISPPVAPSSFVSQFQTPFHVYFLPSLEEFMLLGPTHSSIYNFHPIKQNYGQHQKKKLTTIIKQNTC